MRITKIRIKNFRSIQELEFSPNLGLNILVGENNAGKSNIFIALEKFRKLLQFKDSYEPIPGKHMQTSIFRKEDLYKGDTTRTFDIRIMVELSDVELNKFLEMLFEGHTLDASAIQNLKSELGNILEIMWTSEFKPQVQTLFFFKIGKLYLANDRASIRPIDYSKGIYKVTDWHNIALAFKDKKSGLIDIISSRTKTEQEFISIPFTIYERISKLFVDKYKLFEDIRPRPTATEFELGAVGSLKGADTANVLLGLKTNTDMNLRQRFSEIQTKFAELFPSLNLDAVLDPDSTGIKAGASLRIKNVNLNYEVPPDNIGAGIVEMIHFLTNLIGSEGNVLVLQEPELHLHPSSQRLLFNFLRERKTQNQIFIISHSPFFVDGSEITNNIVVSLVSNKTTVIKLAPNYFADTEKEKLKLRLRAEHKEFIFARAVLILEGPTDAAAFPVFAKTLGFDFDKSNVYLMNVDGVENIPIFKKLVQGFKLPYVIIADSEYKETDATILNPNFEGFLEQKGFAKLFVEAKKEFGRSKPLAGKFVAERIPAKDIPAEIKDVIKKVVDLASK